MLSCLITTLLSLYSQHDHCLSKKHFSTAGNGVDSAAGLGTIL
jgi:hypothetical protein